MAEGVDVGGYFQVWATLREQMESTSGMTQVPSGDEAAGTATGFSLQRTRIDTSVSLFDGLFGMKLLLKLERTVEPLDVYVRLTPWRWLSFRLGQFKTPTTWENVHEDRDLDFALRTRVSTAVGDYSLSRAFYTASQLAGNRGQLRDLGLGLSGTVDLGPVPFRYQLMISNGLGANLWIGGDSNRQFVVSNPPDFFYGARLELDPWPGVITLGGHYSYNKHDDMALGGARVVLDLYRMSWSGDLRVTVPYIGLRLCGMYAGGAILEDYYGDGKDDLWYSGWEARAIWRFTDLMGWLADWGWTRTHAIEVAFRYEGYKTDVDESGAPTLQEDFTFGLNYAWQDNVRVQLDYVLRRTTDVAEPDLRDDLFVVSVQAAI